MSVVNDGDKLKIGIYGGCTTVNNGCCWLDEAYVFCKEIIVRKVGRTVFGNCFPMVKLDDQKFEVYVDRERFNLE